MSVARWILLGVMLCSLGAVTTDTAQLTVTAPVSSNWPDVEQACDTLGATCICSETLDVNDTISGFGHNPTNSVTKECNPGGIFLEGIGGGQPLDQFGSFVLASTIPLSGSTRLFRIEGVQVTNAFEDNRDFTGKTYCLRHYESFDAGYQSPPTPDDNIKGARFDKEAGEPHPGLQSGWRVGTDQPYDFATGFNSSLFGNVGNLPVVEGSSSNVTISDCSGGEECRVEICFDHNRDADNHLHWRAKVTQVSSGLFARWEGKSPNPNATATSGANSFPLDLQMNGTTQSFLDNNAPLGHYIRAVMVAITPSVDGTFWIGPACEIEGCP